ncbi:Transposase and inactivated derivatives [Budvicia aquatica]|uniref:Transposase and inactivated derivatives n=1 Tax=Budvicia aquatica TaxID=82979 RepID=A0A484ZGK1_9GAMM|nr:IS1 family transposase [Budvicia aquatica]VFS46866.1 Transposase and inactivated derivatives [Budvicia aquatica]
MLIYQKAPPACPYCHDATQVRKHGTSRSGFQRYFCSECRRTFQDKYVYQTCRQALSATEA